jgi:hypothetical protein
MLDESTFGVLFLTGFLVLVSLFIASYRRVDPLVSSHLTLLQLTSRLIDLDFRSSMLSPP